MVRTGYTFHESQTARPLPEYDSSVSNFLKNIIQRHIDPSNIVQPRLQGVFENIRSEPVADTLETSWPGLADTAQKSPFSTETIQPTQRSGENGPSIEPSVQAPTQNIWNRQQPDAPLDWIAKGIANVSTVLNTASDKPFKNSESNMLERQAFLSSNNPAPVEANERIQATIAVVKSLKTSDKNDPLKPEAQPYTVEQMLPKFTLNAPTGFNLSPHPAKEPALPAIKIHIGRIEIKAVKETPQPTRKLPEAPKPAMSLDEYIKERKG